MYWVRSNLRLGSRLALFALAVQIIVSFGHVHLHGLVPAFARPPAMADGSATALPGSRGPSNKSDRAVDAYCPICASIQLSASSTLCAAPAFPPPANLGPIGLHLSSELALAAWPHFLFQARAPPCSCLRIA